MSEEVAPGLHQYTRGFQVAFGISYSLVFLATVLRFVHRLRRRQLWWDDFWALVALIFMAFTALVCLIFTGISRERADPMMSAALISWTLAMAQPVAVWASRVSIQAMIVYFLPPGRNRTISEWALVGFCAGWLCTTIPRIFYSGVPIRAIPQGPFELVPTIVILIFDIIATLWQVGWPKYLLSRMKLRKPHRRLFMASFSTALLLLAVNIFHSVMMLTKTNHLLLLTSHLELLLSLVAVNALVLTAYLYSVIRPVNDGSRDDSSSDVSEPKTQVQPSARMVTIHGIMTGASQSNRAPTASGYSSEVGPLTTINTSFYEWSQSGESGRSQVSRPTPPAS
ncbi:hypothetical protein BKA70DRAFT_1198551 [Coprinopsis sp. MPI-PUGE-AT-0042]|nr:hypothetical protein BKA70DRAFT_1198551 [Coprinopsis sp. MPI-PUGE-AT-0042]